MLLLCFSAAASDFGVGLGAGTYNTKGEEEDEKTHKAVLSTLAMLCLLAFMGSSVAQAQECIARGKSVMVRAEGITEAVGTIDLRCAEPMGVLGFGSPDVLEITVELNTSITKRNYGRS